MVQIGQLAVVSLFSHMIFIYLTWRVLTSVLSSINLEPLVHKGKITEAKVFLVFVTIVIGSGVSRFFLEVVQWAQDLMYLF